MDSEYEVVPVTHGGRSETDTVAEPISDPWGDGTVSLRRAGADADRTDREERLRIVRRRHARRVLVKRFLVGMALAGSVALAIGALEVEGNSTSRPGRLTVDAGVGGEAPGRAVAHGPSQTDSRQRVKRRGGGKGRRRRTGERRAREPGAAWAAPASEALAATPSVPPAPPPPVEAPVQSVPQPDPAPSPPPAASEQAGEPAPTEFGFEH